MHTTCTLANKGLTLSPTLLNLAKKLKLGILIEKQTEKGRGVLLVLIVYVLVQLQEFGHMAAISPQQHRAA